MFLPLWEYCSSQLLEVKDKSEQNIHLDLVLAQNDLLELIERKFIHSEADQVCKQSKKSTIIFPVGSSRKTGKDGVVRNFEESSIAFAAIEYLLHEDSFCIFAFKLRQKLLSMRVRCHFILVVAIYELNAFFDQL